MAEHRLTEKAKRYLGLLDTARSNGEWHGVPELARKVGKHAPQRQCLVITARSEFQIIENFRGRPDTSPFNSVPFPNLLPALQKAIENEKDFPEDVFQAKVCLGWLHWTTKNFKSAIETVPTTLPQAIQSKTQNAVPLMSWTYVCMARSAYIYGYAHEHVGNPNEIPAAYERMFRESSKLPIALMEGLECQKWSERFLNRYCMLSARLILSTETFSAKSTNIERHLIPFRAYAELWETYSASHVKIPEFTGMNGRLLGSSTWEAYYSVLSKLLQNGYNNLGIYTSPNWDPSSVSVAQLRLQFYRELRVAEATYERLLLKEVSFPKAHETNTKYRMWIEQVMSNWRIYCGPQWCDEDMGQGGQEIASRNVLEILYRAANLTFHSTPILRHLFTLHASLAEFDLASKALDSYLEIVNKGKARVEKSGQSEADLDTDEILLQTITTGINMFCAYGRRSEVERCHKLRDQLEQWLANNISENFNHYDDTQVSKSTEVTGLVIQSLVSPNILATVYRAIGTSQAQWARLTYEASTRADLRAAAIKNFRKALKSHCGSEDVDTLYALATVLAEARDVSDAIVAAKLALATKLQDLSVLKSLHCQSMFEERSRSRLNKLWHLLALLLSATEDFETATTLCDAALNDCGVIFHVNEKKAGGPFKELETAEKRHIMELKMTQMILTEVIQGPEFAINASSELLELYSTLFGSPDSEDKVQTSRSYSPSHTSRSTTNTLRGGIFARSKPSESLRPSTATDSAGSQGLEANGSSQAPTISVSDGEQLKPPSSSHSTLHRRPSKRLQKQNSTKSIRRSSNTSPMRKFNGSFKAASEHLRPATSRSYGTDAVGLAVSYDLPILPGSPISEIENPGLGSLDMPMNSTSVQTDFGRSGKEKFLESSQESGSREALEKRLKFRFPEPRFSKAEERRKSTKLLLKIWVLIAGLFRRAKLYDEAHNAIDEAFKHIQSVEIAALRQHSSVRSLEDPGWGGEKSVEELWADVYAEKGHLCLARSAPHEAMIEYESALCHHPDHPNATVGLSNILLDIYTETIPPDQSKFELQPHTKKSTASISEEPSTPLLSTLPKLASQLNGSGNFSHNPSSTDKISSPNKDRSASVNSPHKTSLIPPSSNTPEALDRLTARDRAYGLLSSLTKLGTGWDYSEAWYALARAYEVSGQVEKAKELLWWVVELEAKRPVRSWAVLGEGYCL